MEDRTKRNEDGKVKAVVMDMHGVFYTHREDGDVAKSIESEEQFWQENYPEQYKEFLRGNIKPLIEAESDMYRLCKLEMKWFSDADLPAYVMDGAIDFVRKAINVGDYVVPFSMSSTFVSHQLIAPFIGSIPGQEWNDPSLHSRSATDYGTTKKDPETWRKMYATLPHDATIDLVLEDSENNLLAGLEAARSLGHETRGYMPGTCPLTFIESKGYYMGYFKEAAAELLK